MTAGLNEKFSHSFTSLHAAGQEKVKRRARRDGERSRRRKGAPNSKTSIKNTNSHSDPG